MVKEYVVKVAYALGQDWEYAYETEYVRVRVKAESPEEAIRLVDEGDREWEDELGSSDFYTVGPIEDWIVYERDEPTQILRKYAAGERDFVGVDLCEANLAGINLAEADLSGADLSYANLSGANLSEAEMYDVNLYNANLSGADLSGVQMSASVPGDTDGADLSEVDLSGASLRGADLFDINLSGADLSGADLSGADLRSVDLRNASLNLANLSEANLSRAKLGAADLSEANLSGANLQESLYNEETQFPKGFDPVQAGAILVEKDYEDSDDDEEYEEDEDDDYDEEDDDEGSELQSESIDVQQPQSDTAIQAESQLELKDDTDTMNQSEALKTARERLDTILLAIDTAKQLGCMDEGIKQALKYQVRKILLEDIIQPYLPSEWRVSDRAMYLGYSPTRTQLIAIGKEAARLYREQHGDKPPQSEEVVDGQTRFVKIYSGKAIDLLDTAIRKVMEA